MCDCINIFVKSCSKSEEIKGAGDSTLADSAAVADSVASPVPIDSSAMLADSASASPESTSEQSSEDDYTSAGFPRWLVGSWSGHFEGGDVGSYDCTVKFRKMDMSIFMRTTERVTIIQHRAQYPIIATAISMCNIRETPYAGDIGR